MARTHYTVVESMTSIPWDTQTHSHCGRQHFDQLMSTAPLKGLNSLGDLYKTAEIQISKATFVMHNQ